MGENVEREKWNEKYYCIVFCIVCDDIREFYVDFCFFNDGEKVVSDFILSVFNYYCIFSSSDYLYFDCWIFVGLIWEKKNIVFMFFYCRIRWVGGCCCFNFYEKFLCYDFGGVGFLRYWFCRGSFYCYVVYW